MLQRKFNWNVTVRSIKDRVALLLKKYRTEESTSSTGTEIRKSERGRLLEIIDNIAQEEAASINYKTSPENNDITENETDDESDVISVAESDDDSNPPPNRKKPIINKSSRLVERKRADAERDKFQNFVLWYWAIFSIFRSRWKHR